ncbi:PIN domain-containing protein [Actinomycetospora sp. NBRC 106378]|uniref:PIN domain-containing protein n=1 Tax=Actinomycetospora sp. NBRC 106378 TaxID=3032208 RepID=UPI003324196B
MLLLDSHTRTLVPRRSSETGARGPRRDRRRRCRPRVGDVGVGVVDQAHARRLDLPENLVDALAAQGLTMLPVSAEQAEGVRTLPAALRRHDPFDRLLVAQARALGLTLLTADRVLLGLDLPFVVDATR